MMMGVCVCRLMIDTHGCCCVWKLDNEDDVDAGFSPAKAGGRSVAVYT